MTENKRIFLNVIATYGRSLFQLFCGLFTARWALMALGKIDYGLYGVVGGLTVFVVFFNDLLANAVSRFYAYAVGEAKRPGNESNGLIECREWFSTALMIHMVLPFVLIIVGYPLGSWAVKNFLTIPTLRVDACLWVWRLVCVTCLFSMVNVPFRAMYTAKQNIAELTIYSFVTTTLNVIVMYYMVTHPSDWLVKYAAWMMLLSVVPQIIICVRGCVIYPECRVVRGGLLNLGKLKEVMSFSGYQFLNGISMIGANQGQSVVVNKYLGPVANAAMTIGNQVSAHTQALASALAGAFAPAITNAAGEGDLIKMRKLAMRASKFGSLAVLFFSIPLSLEIDAVLKIWLHDPPNHAAGLCVCLLIAMVLDKLTAGHWMSIFAIGNIAGYQLAACTPSFFAFFLGWALVAEGMGVVGVGIALASSKILTNLIRLPFGRNVAGITISSWLRNVLLPVAIVACLSVSVGLLPRFVMAESLVRIMSTGIASCSVFLLSIWLFAMDADERLLVVNKIRKHRLYKMAHYLKIALMVRVAQMRYRGVLRRLRAKAQRHEPIKVLFLVHISSKWKCQALYDWMAKDARFDPIVGLDIDLNSKEIGDSNLCNERDFYSRLGCRTIDVSQDGTMGDIVFYQEPFGNRVEILPYNMAQHALTFYVPYYVPTHDTWQRACLVPDFHGYLFRQFAPSSAWAKYYTSHVSWYNYGGKIMGLGHPMLDVFDDLGDDYVIYAPHFSFRNNRVSITVDISTFRESGLAILEYAKKHPEFKWLFKPHPRLRWFLEASGEMTKIEVDTYYAEWERIGTACYTGEYPYYFNRSRAMITDCSSFLGEYAATGKPLIHLVYGHNQDENNKASSVVEALFRSFYTVETNEDLASALKTILEDEEDPKREERIAVATEVGFYKTKAASAIGEYLKSMLGMQ